MPTTTPFTLTALTDVVKIAESIAALKTELAGIFSNHPASMEAAHTEESAPSSVKAKRKFSASHRAKLVAAQKARWAKIKGKKTRSNAKTATPVKKKRNIPLEARAKMAAAAKARWAAQRARKTSESAAKR